MTRPYRNLTLAIVSTCLIAAPASAEPEKAYQAAKALAKVTPVDDRAIEQRAGDYLKNKGAGKNTPFWSNKPTPAESPKKQPKN